jgi:hypothetical protein
MLPWGEYVFSSDNFPGGTRVEVRKKKDNTRLSFMAVLDLLAQRDRGFLDGFLHMLKSLAFEAYFFETPPITFFTVSNY